MRFSDCVTHQSASSVVPSTLCSTHQRMNLKLPSCRQLTLRTPAPSRQFFPSISKRSKPVLTPRGSRLFSAERVAGPVAHGPLSDEDQKDEDVNKKFVWEKNWYAVLPEKLADPSKPYGFALLGRELVLWRDAQEVWRVLEDRCSHRKALLSRGRLSKKDGTLMCGFHGWCFNGEGQCTRIPQAPDSQHDRFRSSRRSGVAAYPVLLKKGLIWVWGESSPRAWVESSMRDIEAWEEFPDAADYAWPVDDVPIGYHMAMEMAFDPCHTPIVHEGTMVGDGEDGAVPMDMKLVKFGKDGFSLISSGYMRNMADYRTTMEFKAPGTCSAVYNKPGGVKSIMQVHCTPTTPGRCRVINAFKTTLPDEGNSKTGFPRRISKINLKAIFKALKNAFVMALVEFLPTSWKIARNHGLSRTMLIHKQDDFVTFGLDQVLNGIEKKWKKDYHAPTKSDVGVLAFRGWLDRHSGGDVKWAPGAKVDEAKSLEQVFDRWDRHTKHCKHCKKTAKDLVGWVILLRRLATVSLIATGVFLVVPRTFQAKPCIAGLVIAGLSMLAAGKIDAILSMLKSNIPRDALPGNVDLYYRESTG